MCVPLIFLLCNDGLFFVKIDAFFFFFFAKHLSNCQVYLLASVYICFCLEMDTFFSYFRVVSHPFVRMAIMLSYMTLLINGESLPSVSRWHLSVTGCRFGILPFALCLAPAQERGAGA